MRNWMIGLAMATLFCGAATAQQGGAAARVAALEAAGGGAEIRISLTAPLAGPPRVHLRADPMRVALDLPGARWAQPAAPPLAGGPVAGLRLGVGPAGAARLVVDLAAPARPRGLAVTSDGAGKALRLRLAPAAMAAFRAAARADIPAAPVPAPLIALDPGHGGHDPGAAHGELVEKDLMLDLAHELAGALRAAGYRVMLTRERDAFLRLDARSLAARRAGAALLLSLHADAAPEAYVAGASVYLYGGIASDRIAAALAERLSEPDALAGGAAAAGADVAGALGPLIAQGTAARSEALGAALTRALGARLPMLEGRPLRAARFRVLRAPDLPAALIEFGFLSNARDRARLVDPLWRAAAAAALVDALGEVAPLPDPGR